MNLIKSFLRMKPEEQAGVLAACGLIGIWLIGFARIWLPETLALNIVKDVFAFMAVCGALRMLFSGPKPSGTEKMWRWPLYGCSIWLAVVFLGLIIEESLNNFGLSIGRFLGWTQGIIAVISVIGIVYCAIVSAIRERRCRQRFS